MPIVRVRKSNKYTNFSSLNNLAVILKHATAKALNVPGNPDGLLSASEVEVYFENFQANDMYSKNLAIIIEADFLSERHKNLEARTKLIVEEAREWIPKGFTFFVWVRLARGAYAEG